MANREYFQGDQSQGSYEFVGRPTQDNAYQNQRPGGDPYSSGYGSQQQHQQQYGGGGYNGSAPPARYESGAGYGNSPPPAYGQTDPYTSQSGYGSQQQQHHQQRPQNYPNDHEQSRYGAGPPSGPGYGQQNPSYGQAPQQYPGGPQPQGQGQGGGEGERGIMGALAGGAAGGFGGHKVGHGVLGAVGGAVAGSMLQDHFHKEKKEKEDHKHQQQQQQQQQHHGFFGGRGGGGPPPPHHQNFAGNFSASSTDISLDRDFDLIARCGDGGGGHRLTSINLNNCLTNDFGQLKWERGGNFGGSARNVRLADQGRVLEAELGDGSGGWKHAFIYLDEKITNEGGELRFLG